MAWLNGSQLRKEDAQPWRSWDEFLEDIAVSLRPAGLTLAASASPTPNPDSPPPSEAAFLAPLDEPVPTAEPTPVPTLPFFPLPAFLVDADSADFPLGGGAAVMTAPFGSFDGGAPMLQALAANAGQFLVLFNADLSPGPVIDMGKREILTGGAQDPVLGAGENDTLVAGGPLAGGSTVPAGLAGIENVVLQPGSSFDLASGDEVAPGGTLTVSAMPLGADDALRFDGSGEIDGRLVLFGGPGPDELIGGAGDDRVAGMDGADILAGGAGADVFVYGNAGQSSGAGYDTLTDFDPAEDRIDLPGEVSGFDDAVEAGALSTGSFDDDLTAALGEDGLGAGQAVLFAPDEGDLAGTVFLIVDGNGEAGYQAGEDFVFALPNADLPDLSGDVAIFV